MFAKLLSVRQVHDGSGRLELDGPDAAGAPHAGHGQLLLLLLLLYRLVRRRRATGPHARLHRHLPRSDITQPSGAITTMLYNVKMLDIKCNSNLYPTINVMLKSRMHLTRNITFAPQFTDSEGMEGCVNLELVVPTGN